MPPDLRPEHGRRERPLSVVALDAVWVALVTAYVLLAVMGFGRWLLAVGLAVLFALSVGTVRPVLALLVGDEGTERAAVGAREAAGVVLRALFPRLPSGPDPGGRG
jgi:hypothetical protein